MSPPTENSSSTIKRIDWLSVAPWTLLFRVPGVALGKPFLFAMIATLLLGDFVPCFPMSGGPILQVLEVWPASLTWNAVRFFESVFDSAEWFPLLSSAGKNLAWALMGIFVVDSAARQLTDSQPANIGNVLERFRPQALRLVGSFFLVGISISVFFLPLGLIKLACSSEFSAGVVEKTLPFVLLCLVLPLYLVTTGFFIAWPMLVSAIVIDKADAFDGVSRLFAYLFQRLLKLVCYLCVAILMGVVVSYFVYMASWGVSAIESQFLPNVALDPLGLKTDADAYVESSPLFASLLQSYLTAYFFTAWTAIYMLLRQDIDDQPLDEMVA